MFQKRLPKGIPSPLEQLFTVISTEAARQLASPWMHSAVNGFFLKQRAGPASVFLWPQL